MLTHHSNLSHPSMLSTSTMIMSTTPMDNYTNQRKFSDPLKPTAQAPLPITTPLGRTSKNGSPVTPGSRKATFTTYEQMRYEAGRPGVYINPKLRGSAEPTRGRPIKRPRLVVFKSEKLKDNLWLEKRRGTWHEYVAEAIASQIIDAENNGPVPPKRKLPEKKRLYSATSSASPSSLPNSLSLLTSHHHLHDKNNPPTTKPLPPSSSSSSSPSLSSSPNLQSQKRKLVSPSQSSLADSDNESSSSSNQDLDEANPAHLDSPTSRNSQPSPKSHLKKSRRLLPSEISSQKLQESQMSVSPNQSQHQHQMRPMRSDVYNHSQFSKNPTSQTSLQRNTAQPTLDGMNGHDATYDSFFPCGSMPSGPGLDQSKFQNPASPYQQSNNSNSNNLNNRMNNNNNRHHYLSNPAMMSSIPNSHPQLTAYRSNFHATDDPNGANYGNQQTSQNSPAQRHFVNQMRPNGHSSYMSTENSMGNDVTSASMNRDLRLQPSYASRCTKSAVCASHESLNAGNPQNHSSLQTSAAPSCMSSSSTKLITHPHSNMQFLDQNERIQMAQSPDISRVAHGNRGINSVRSSSGSEVDLSATDINGMEASSSSSYHTSPPSPMKQTPKSTKRRQSQSECANVQQIDNYSTAQDSMSHLPKGDFKRRAWPSEPIIFGEPDLDNSASISFPPEVDRLTCRYQGRAGNLILSANKQVLEFFPAELNRPLSDPQLRLAISWIPQNPFTSVAGSKPMELRVKALHPPNNTLNVYVFEFPPVPGAIDAANHMRAKIVTGIVACKFRNGQDYNHPVEIKENIQKPYQCETCDKRFKNQNGLEYHVSKAATTCNPNFDPLVGPGKRGRKRRKPLPETTLTNEDAGKEEGVVIG